MERPSYTRQDTDVVGVENEKKTYGISTSVDSKGSEKGGIDAVPPTYHDSEAAIGEGEIGALETAEDIVTQVIHTDDDPTINPWTFRMFFIGKLSKHKHQRSIYMSNFNKKQDSVCPHLVLSCRRSSTSSPRSFTFRSCS
jgi:hypothetical protein